MRLIIRFTNGEPDIWEPTEYDDYFYDGDFFVVKKNNNYVGIYPTRFIKAITIR